MIPITVVRLAKQNIAITLDTEVLQEIDEERGLVKRSTFVNSLLATLLKKRKMTA